MHRVCRRGLAALAALAAIAVGRARPVAAQRITTEPQRVVTLTTGESALMAYEGPVQRFSIGDPAVVDAGAVSPKELVITGKKLGTTSLFVWDQAGQVRVYSVQVTADAPALERYLRTLFPRDSISVAAGGNTVTLSGRVHTAAAARQAADIAKGTGATVVDRLQAPPARQVLLKVRFAEVSRSAAREMATRLATLNPHKLSTGGDWRGETMSDGLLQLFLMNANAEFDAIIRVLQSRGDFKSLAEPNLLALPGQEASFLAGGEFPFPVVQGTAGSTSIVWKEFGVRLKFTPTVTEGDNIRLHVAPEVSSLDFGNGLTSSGFQIPSILTRRTETDVELREGQHLAIAGLLDNTTTQNLTKIPVLGDLPILGALFRSRSLKQNRSELLVIVTPQFVDATDTAPAIPTGEPDTWQWEGSLRTKGPMPESN
ncbi:MAG TPA: type II and III secretion system protein family protein [Gemmatimonadales bacterium]|nr:type II and III secretion system protein family protein [Gemmatimonadales bacterium]